MLTKRKLAILLSKLKDFEKPKLHLEQYITDPEVASTLLWIAYMSGDILGKKVVDLGAGTGILGIGALLLGAREVHFVEIDPDAIRVLEENVKKFGVGNYYIWNTDVTKFKGEFDTALLNPPFGIQTKNGSDFLIAASRLANKLYIIHSSIDRVRRYLPGYEVEVLEELKMKIGKRFYFHEKDKVFVKVYLLRAVRPQ